jgi:hypothetical protein
MDLREIIWAGIDWIDLVQDRNQWRAFMNTVINPWVCIKQCEILD